MQEWQEKIEKRLDQLERETEPMRLERRLSIPEANTLQKIMDQVGTMTPDVAHLKVDISKMEKQMATKDDISKLETRLDTMATKDDLKALEKRFDVIKSLQEQILDRLPKPPE